MRLTNSSRKLSHLGRRPRRQGGDLFFDFLRDGFPRVMRLGRQRCRVQFAGLDFFDDGVARLLESAELFDAGVCEVQGIKAKRRPPKRQLGQAHPAQHEQPQIKRREARGKMDHRRQRHRLVFCLQKRQQLPPQPSAWQPGEPLGHSIAGNCSFGLAKREKPSTHARPKHDEDAKVRADVRWTAPHQPRKHALGRVQIIENDRVAEQEQRGEQPNTGEDQKDTVLLFWGVGEHRGRSEFELEQANLERECLLHVGRLEQALGGLDRLQVLERLPGGQSLADGL